MIPPRVAAFASRIGLTGLAIAILVLLLAVQTVRLEGFKIWPFSIEGTRPKAERLEADLKAVMLAQGAAEREHLAAKKATEQTYRDVAERIDDVATEARAGALADADRFIAANRVRPAAAGCPASQAAPATRDRGARDREAVPAAPVMDGAVAVPAEDVRICTVNTLQAEAGRAWALELEAASKRGPPDQPDR